MQRAEVHYACRDACVVHGILQDEWPCWGTRADYLEAVQPQRKYKVSSSGPKRNDAVWWRFIQE